MKSLNLKRYLIFLFASLLITSADALAVDQALDDQEILNVEGLYKNLPVTRPAASPKASEPREVSPAEEAAANDSKSVEQVEKDIILDQKVEKIADLNKLSPFKEISVIQKKFLPKTERYQLYGGLGTTTNSPWFLNLGLKLNFGYFFTESLGIEASGVFLSNTEKQVAKEIRDNNSLQPEKFVNTKSYLGLDFVWAPIYGKLTMLNERIIPFDMYFSFGGGTSSTNSVEGSVPTFHVATGQIFAITKGMAFRWDYSWTFFQATPIPSSGGISTGSPGKNSYNDLILTAGFSFFFPEANYR